MLIKQFYEELKRRKVFRVCITYAITAWVAIQVIDTVFPILNIPDWTVTLLTVIILIGFPFALIIAWAFELTENGIRKTSEPEDNSEKIPTTQSLGNQDQISTTNEQTILLPLSLKIFGAVILISSLGLIWFLNQSAPQSDKVQRSIAVLPFETINESETSSFTKGIQGGLMTRLSNISELRVTSRTSTLQYANVVKSISLIGEELGVEWIVRGEVQEVNGQILVNARLIKAQEDQQVWAKEYQRRLTLYNIFEIQSDLTRQIVSEVQARITTEERERVDRKPTNDLQAFRDFAQGVSLLEQRTPAAILASIEFFMNALKQDPDFAPAWAVLAEALIYIEFYEYADIESYSVTAEEAIQRAMESNPELAEAHASMGIFRYTQKDGLGAIESLIKAIELQPSYETANNWLNFLYLLVGQPEESLKYAARTIEISPLAPASRLYPSLSYLANGQKEEALRQVNRAREIQPDWGEVYAIRGVILYHNQKFEEALESLFNADLLIKNEVSSIWVPDVRTMIEITAMAIQKENNYNESDIRLPAKKNSFWSGLKLSAEGQYVEAKNEYNSIREYSMWPNISLRYLFPELLREYRTQPDYDQLISNMNTVWTGSE